MIGGLNCGAYSTLHPDPVIAVAGDAVQPSELRDVVVDDRLGRGQSSNDYCSALS
jgi:hypothetical protein